jgi:hypothetical protein
VQRSFTWGGRSATWLTQVLQPPLLVVAHRLFKRRNPL